MTLRFVARNLRKRPFLNLIKVLGLSLSLSAVLVISLFLKHELTFDSFHEKSERIYRFTTTSPTFLQGKHFARLNNPAYIPEMTENFPGIENFVRLAPMRGGVLEYEENFYNMNQAFECDSTFFKVFDAELVMGNPETVLDAPGSMILTESYASKIFGKQNPIGEILSLPAGQFYGENTDYTVAGVMKDFPKNSHFHPELITSPFDKNIFNGWAWTYLVLAENASPETITSGFKKFYITYYEADSEEVKIEAFLQPISDIHLRSSKTREIEANSTMSVVYSFSLAALLLLFIAMINYANLNIGMAGYSDRFLFIGKVFGSSNRKQLEYFLLEGLAIATLSLLCSLVIAGLALEFIQNHFSLNLASGNVFFILSVVLLFSLLGVLAGFLPLLRQFIINITSFQALRSGGKFRRRGISKGLIVMQYTISIALIVAVFVIHRQTNYALKSSMGNESDRLVCFENVHASIQENFSEFKEELQKYNSIQSVSAMLEPPGGESNDMFRFTMEGFVEDENDPTDDFIGIFPCDYSFASVFNLKFIGGKNFSEQFEDHEGSGEYIINESAMLRLNYSNPEDIVGKEFGLIFGNGDIPIPGGKIIGVVEDFYLSSIKRKVDPQVLFKRKDLWLINFIVAFQPGKQSQGRADLEKVWAELFPAYPMKYEHIGSMYRSVYSSELLQSRLLSIFTIIALIICSMGLLGLSLLTTQRRIKEIGIRKVNGAEAREILNLLNWGFIKWIFLSFFLAIPISWFAMTKWLESFAYKTTLSWWIFALAGLAAFTIALLTVSVQSWRAANMNPIEALRCE